MYPPDEPDRDATRPEKDYFLSRSPERSLAQIAKVQGEMPEGRFTPPPHDWAHLRRTRRVLAEGGELRLLAVGDSIVAEIRLETWAVFRLEVPRVRRSHLFVLALGERLIVEPVCGRYQVDQDLIDGARLMRATRSTSSRIGRVMVRENTRPMMMVPSMTASAARMNLPRS